MGKAEMDSDEFEIQAIRASIDQDWSELASGKLTAEQRKARREHLEMNVDALRDLVQRSQLAKQRAKLQQKDDWRSRL
jgi:hypothetical protein